MKTTPTLSFVLTLAMGLPLASADSLGTPAPEQAKALDPARRPQTSEVHKLMDEAVRREGAAPGEIDEVTRIAIGGLPSCAPDSPAAAAERQGLALRFGSFRAGDSELMARRQDGVLAELTELLHAGHACAGFAAAVLASKLGRHVEAANHLERYTVAQPDNENFQLKLGALKQTLSRNVATLVVELPTGIGEVRIDNHVWARSELLAHPAGVRVHIQPGSHEVSAALATGRVTKRVMTRPGAEQRVRLQPEPQPSPRPARLLDLERAGGSSNTGSGPASAEAPGSQESGAGPWIAVGLIGGGLAAAGGAVATVFAVEHADYYNSHDCHTSPTPKCRDARDGFGTAQAMQLIAFSTAATLVSGALLLYLLEDDDPPEAAARCGPSLASHLGVHCAGRF